MTKLNNVKKSFYAGDKPAIDTLEASINYKNRILDLEKAKLRCSKAKLAIANYLWLENDTPLELSETMIPDGNTIDKIDIVLKTSVVDALNYNIDIHPKLKQLQFKKQNLIIAVFNS